MKLITKSAVQLILWVLVSTAFYSKAVDVVLPVQVNIIKEPTDLGLAIRAKQYHVNAVYLADRFEDIQLQFDIVRLDASISQYQMQIVNLVHLCDNKEIYPETRLDQQVIHEGYSLSELTFNRIDDGVYRRHTVNFQFPSLPRAEHSQLCQGTFSLSVSEQL